MSLYMTQHLVVPRGDSKDITLTMPDGSALMSAESVTFYGAIHSLASGFADAFWEQAVTPSSDTVAVVSLGTTEWADWEDEGEPSVVHFAIRVVNASGDPHTASFGTIQVIPTAAS